MAGSFGLLAGGLAAQPLLQRAPLARANPIPRGEIEIWSVSQAKEGSQYHLRGSARLETAELLLLADEIDYDEDTGEAEARGSVYLKHFAQGEELWADRVEYNVDEESGKFYNVRGSAPVHIEARRGVLASSSPFHFEGRWAERLEDPLRASRRLHHQLQDAPAVVGIARPQVRCHSRGPRPGLPLPVPAPQGPAVLRAILLQVAEETAAPERPAHT